MKGINCTVLLYLSGFELVTPKYNWLNNGWCLKNIGIKHQIGSLMLRIHVKSYHIDIIGVLQSFSNEFFIAMLANCVVGSKKILPLYVTVPAIIIHGPTASGKTTISKMVCSSLRTAYISADSLLADDVSATAAEAKKHLQNNQVGSL